MVFSAFKQHLHNGLIKFLSGDKEFYGIRFLCRSYFVIIDVAASECLVFVDKALCIDHKVVLPYDGSCSDEGRNNHGNHDHGNYTRTVLAK